MERLSGEQVPKGITAAAWPKRPNEPASVDTVDSASVDLASQQLPSPQLSAPLSSHGGQERLVIVCIRSRS